MKLSSHMKFLIISVMADSICFSMPWTLVRNWVCPSTFTWIIWTLPIMVGLDFPHLLKFLFILSKSTSHGDASSVWFLIHAPRDLMAFPSSGIFIHMLRVALSFWLTLRVVIMHLLCSSEPISNISKFFILNLVVV